VAIVTGAASGIGHAVARRLLAAGWCVAVADLQADRLTELFSGGSDTVLVQPTDVTRLADIERLFTETVARFGGVDGVTNAAGISLLEDARIEDVDLDVFDRTCAVNLRGTFMMCRAAIGPLRERHGGAIVNFGSVASLRGGGGTAYVTTKAGIAGLSRAIAAHYAKERIRCNTVAPGATTTPMLEISKRKSTVSIGGPSVLDGEAEPDEIAGLVEFLLGPSGRFVTGATYAIDGGITQH
jgi:NAD(P)-dependent dehydrogenase (short-subunit alcohol dehydrogenase family)